MDDSIITHKTLDHAHKITHLERYNKTNKHPETSQTTNKSKEPAVKYSLPLKLRGVPRIILPIVSSIPIPPLFPLILPSPSPNRSIIHSTMSQPGSGMAPGTSHQTDASQQGNENTSQWKTCQCEEGEGSLWSCKLNDNQEKHVTSVRCSNCQNLLVFKSGHMLISSKGLGWTSWKRRWFMLTRESLIFFRSDPNAPPPPQQRGNELNLYLDTIELNNSGSVVARTDKKLLTVSFPVSFPESRDGRTFTLKAETLEDLHEWKNVLEIAISQAPSPPVATGGQSTTSQNDETNDDGSQHSAKDKVTEKLKVIGRPILYALTEIDGNPAFLEKALTFIEEYGITVEGILRQSADVEEVLHRFDEYERGRIEFSPDEDAHVIGDCIKYVLRELPSSPVPASCCTALVDALKGGDRGSRVSNIRSVIFDTFPEPNRQLLQRILEMMLIVASHKSENLMSLSAAAACMAPLLLRPLLAGECELKDEFEMGGGGDGSMQLLQAAAAANHAQTIVIILLEHFDRIFTDLEDYSSETYSETEGSEEEDDYEDEESIYSENEQETGICDEHDNDSETDDESGIDLDSDGNENKEIDSHHLDITISKVDRDSEAIKNKDGVGKHDLPLQRVFSRKPSNLEPLQLARDTTSNNSSSILDRESSAAKTEIIERQILQPYEVKEVDKVKGLGSSRRSAIWGRTSAKKNLSMETSDCLGDDETSVLRLESTKSDLQAKLTNEVKENEVLKANLENRKEALCELQLSLQKEVERLKLLLEKEKDLRVSLEAGLNSMQPKPPISYSIDSKTRKDLEDIADAETDITNLKQKATDLKGQIDEQKQKKSDCLCATCGQQLYGNHQFNKEMKNTETNADENSKRNQKYCSTTIDRRNEPEDAYLKSQKIPCHEEISSVVNENRQNMTGLNNAKPIDSSSSSSYESFPTEANASVPPKYHKAQIASSKSLQHKQSLRKMHHSFRNTKTLNPLLSMSSHEDTLKKTSPRGEDASGSSSALTRLTSRLNFLKERRVQLVNELQTVDTNNDRGVKCPPRSNTTNSR